MWLGEGILNRTGAEIGYLVDKKWKKNHFLWLKKFKNTESAKLCKSDTIVASSQILKAIFFWKCQNINCLI